MRASPRDTPVLLYDGDCGFCAGSVQFVLSHEPPNRTSALQFAPLQGAFGAEMRERFRELAAVDSVVWYEPGPSGGRVLIYSDAGLAVLRHLGGAWRALGAIAHLVPRVLRDTVYRYIAKHRLDIAAPACLLPAPDQRARFLD